MRNFCTIGLTALLLFGASGAAAYEDKNHEVAEVSVTGGLRTSGSFDNNRTDPDFKVDWNLSSGFTWGVLFDFEVVRDRLDIEASAEGQPGAKLTSTGERNNDTETKLSSTYFQIGVRWKFPQENWTPYLTGRVGAVYFSSKESFDSTTRFAGSLGVGAKKSFSERFGVRVDLRGYGADVATDTSIHCDENAQCEDARSSDLMLQGDFKAGVFFGF